VVCAEWDLTRPTIPSRSRLYSLEPVGIGTPETESLTSYVSRLAEAHSVRVHDLVVHKLLPFWDVRTWPMAGTQASSPPSGAMRLAR